MPLDINHVEMAAWNIAQWFDLKNLSSPTAVGEKKGEGYQPSFLINDMSPSAPIMAAGSNLMISI